MKNENFIDVAENFSINQDRKKELQEIAQIYFDKFKERGTMVEGGYKTVFNLKMNNLDNYNKGLIIGRIIEGISNSQNITSQEEDFIMDRLIFLFSGNIDKSSEIH